MDYTTFIEEGTQEQLLNKEQVTSLFELCQGIEDKRAARGKQYDLAGLLIVLILARIGRDEEPVGSKRLGARSRRVASSGTPGLLEADAVCQHLQIRARVSRESTGQ